MEITRIDVWFGIIEIVSCIRLMKWFQVVSSASPKWRPAPTRREQEKWDRATKATTGGTVCHDHFCDIFCSTYFCDFLAKCLLREPSGWIAFLLRVAERITNHSKLFTPRM